MECSETAQKDSSVQYNNHLQSQENSFAEFVTFLNMFQLILTPASQSICRMITFIFEKKRMLKGKDHVKNYTQLVT